MEAAALILLLVLPGTLAGPLDWTYNDFSGRSSSDECASRCTGTSKFQYDIGKTYQYKYDVTSETSLTGSGEGAARIEVAATASIHVLSKCELALTLSNVVFKTSEPDSTQLKELDDWDYKSVLEGSDLRFSFQDGKIEDLCPSPDDTVKSLNFKRGILSAFQNSMNQHERDESLQETDVTGTCRTQYTVDDKGLKSRKFTKVKDLLGCSDRQSYETFMQSTPFKLPNAIQSLPLLKGNHECKQIVAADGHLLSSSCTEALTFRPFSKKEAGAGTKTTQELQHLQTVPGTNVMKDTVTETTSLLFEHERKSAGDDKSWWPAREKLNTLCRLTVENIPSSAPGLFTDLVYLMRDLESAEIMSIAEGLHRGNICGDNKDKGKKFFFDAIPMLGTSHSVEVLVELLLGGHVSGVEAEMWILSFNFIHEPTEKMILDGKRLLKSDSLRKSSLLPVTSLINSYCRSHSCVSNGDVRDVVNVLADILGKRCDSPDEDLVLLALRAARNMGQSHELAPVLSSCMEARENSMAKRVFAAEAFRGVSCDVTDRKALMDTFMNKGEDSELRIAAYLSLMQCPTEVILSEVRKALEKESVNQVGSFVWTHLTNLLRTSSPQKQGIREILEDEKLKKEFNMDKRKYSRNYELSFFSERYGAGAMAESNVVFSSSSFIPRSAMLNLTVDMLGQSVNVLEVGGRVQGLELLLQKYMGSFFSGEENKGKSGPSSSCVRQQKMDKMKDKFAVSKDDLEASFYVRMFGNELGFEYLSGEELMNIKDKFNLKTIMKTLAKGDDISFTKSAMFMDSSVAVPTIAGMALRLSVNGTATVELVANGKIDMRKISRKNMAANFNFRPSAAVQLSGLMSVEAGAARSGLRMTTTLHTTSATTGSLDLTNGQVVSVDFDTPVEKMELLDVKSEFFILHTEAEKSVEMKQNSLVSKRTCSPDMLLKVTGYKVCGEFSFMRPATPETSPYFPLTGPVKLSLTLDKKDAPSGFKLVAKQVQNTDTSEFHLLVDTPRSNQDRKLTVDYFLDQRAKSLEAELATPWKKMLVKGAYTVGDDTRLLSASVVVDGREYELLTQLDKDAKGSKVKWTPTFKLSRPQDSKILAKVPVQFKVTGSVEVDKKYQDVSADITINSGLKPDPIQLKGNYINKEKQKTLFGSVKLGVKDTYSGTLQLLNVGGKQAKSLKLQPTILFSSPEARLFLLSGSVDHKKDKITKGNLQVTMDNILKKPAVLEFKVTKQKKTRSDKYKGTGKVTSDIISMKARGTMTTQSGEAIKKGSLLNGKMTVDYNFHVLKNKSMRKNHVVFSTKVYDRSTKALRKYDVNLNMDNKKYPEGSFVTNTELSHKATLSKVMFSMTQGAKAQLLKDKSKMTTLGATLYHIIDPESADIRYDLQVIHPPKNIEYEVKGKHEHKLGKQFSFETYTNIIYAKRKSIEFRLQGENTGKKSSLDYRGLLELSFPDFKIRGKTVDARSYKIASNLQRTPEKEYIHTINLRVNNKDKHNLVTKFKKMRGGFFDLYSQAQVGGEKPATMTVELSRGEKLVKAVLDFMSTERKYEYEVSSETLGERYYLNTWNFKSPERRVKGSLEGFQQEDNEYTVKMIQAWDADRQPDQKIDLLASLTVLNENNKRKHEANILVNTPFEGYKIFQYRDLQEANNTFAKQELKVIWAVEENELSYSTWVHLPLSAERVEMTFDLVTPAEVLRKFNVEINHKMDGTKHLSTKVKSVYNKDDVAVKVLYSNKEHNNKKKLDVSLIVSSTSLPQIKNVALTLKYNDMKKRIKTQAAYTRNGDQYTGTMISQYSKVESLWLVQSSLDVTFPSERPLTMNLKMIPSKVGNDGKLMNFSLSLDWKPEYNFDVKAGAKYSVTGEDTAYDVDIKLPLEKMKRIEYFARTEQKGMKGHYFYRFNEDPKTTYDTKYMLSKTETEIDYTAGKITFTLRALYSKFPYTVYTQTTWPGEKSPSEKKIVFDCSVDENTFSGWSATAKLVTPFEEAQNVNIRGDVKKMTETDWNLDGEISVGVREKITITSTVDAEKWQRINAEIRTPYKEMTSLSVGHNLVEKDGVYSSESHLEVQPVFNRVKVEQTLTLKPDISMKYKMLLPNTEFKFIEVSLDHKEQRRGVKTHVNVKYHPTQEIDLLFKTKFNKNRFPDNTKVFLDLRTPFEVLPTFNFKTTLDKDADKWLGNLDLKTGAKQLEYLKVNVEQASSETSCHSDFTVESSVFKTVSAGMHFDWGDLAAVNLTLDAPRVGRSVLGFRKKSKSWTDFQSKVFMEINENDLDMDIGLKHEEKETKAWLSYVYPGADKSYIKTSVHRIGDSPRDFDVGGFLQVGRDTKPYNVSMQYSNTPAKFALGTTFESPYTKALSYLLSGESQSNGGHDSKVYVKYGERLFLDTMSSVKLRDASVVYKVSTEYKFEESSHKSGTTLKADWSKMGEEVFMESYANEYWVKAEMTHAKAKSNEKGQETVDLLVFTPFEGYKDIGLHAAVMAKPEHFNGKCNLEYTDDKEAVLTFDLAKTTKNKVAVKADLALPIEGYKKNTLVYSQISRRNKFEADGEVVTGKNERIAGKVEFLNKKNFKLTLSGPVEKFESLVVSGKYDQTELKVEGDANLKLAMNPAPVTLDFNVHINNEPVLIDLKLKSPYDEVKMVDLDVKHWGREWKQFRTVATLESNRIGLVKSETKWRFVSTSDMEGSTSLSSPLKNLENARLVFSNKDSSKGKTSHLEIGWSKDQEITSDLDWSISESSWKERARVKLDVATTLEQFRKAGVALTHVYGNKNIQDSVKIHHNGKTHLDADINYDYSDRHQGTVEIRSPRPITVEGSGSLGTKAFDGKLKFNWDKRNPEGHIEMETEYADKSESQNVDKSFKFKVFNPARVMGVDCSFKQSDKELLSAGLITWNQQKGKTFSYDIGWNDRTSRYSKMYEGHAKLGVPERSVKVQSSFSDSGTKQSASSAVFWDADKDETKKVTMSTTVESKDKTKRVVLNVNLPNINKQLNLGVTSKGGYGTTLLDTKAELSYSSDPSKMITITSKVSNQELLSDKFYNYTVELGFMHPVTGIDMQLTSHMGSTENMCSTGSRLTFDTARRETKTLEFRAQLDKARKNMEIQVVTPIKDVRVEGRLDNKRGRQHAVWRSFEEGKQTMRLDLAIDRQRRNMDVEFNYDQDDPDKMVTLSGRYINDSAVQMDLITYQTKGQFTSESMIAVRLNSSNILHTRITWRPTLLDELQTFLSTKVTAFSYIAMQTFNDASTSVGTEVKAKYVLMSKELGSELEQVFSLMEKEMESLNGQLGALNTQIRRAYLRNDLHIKDMGDQAKAAFKEIMTEMNNLMMNYRSYHVKVTQAAKDWLADLSSFPVAQRYNSAVQGLVRGIRGVRSALDEALTEVGLGMKKFSKVSHQWYMTLSRDLDNRLNSYERLMNKLPEVQKLMAQQAEPSKQGGESLIHPSHMYSQLYLQGHRILQDQFHDLMARPEFLHAHAMASEVHLQFQFWNADKSLANGVRRLLELSKNLVLMQLKQLKNSLMELDKNRVIVFDPQRGELQVEVYLPFPLKSLAEVPKIKPGKYAAKLKELTQIELPTTDGMLWDTYYNYVPSVETSEWVPPFDGSAYLIGSQHYLTFDKHQYDFMSQCSHVLARDMLNDSFSIVVNYGKRPRHSGVKSLCFHVENSINFEIANDYKLTINKKEAEMPFISDKVKIFHEGDFVRVEYVGGFEALLNPKLDLYKVTVSGWYHGRLAGMLGAYDNEPDNDMMTSSTWDSLEVNRKSCNKKNVAVMPDSNTKTDKRCLQYFQESSKFRACFKQVDPSHFGQMCQTYLDSMSVEEAVRRATEQYRFVCQGYGIFMGPASEYAPCASKKPFEVDRRDALYQSADVLFVVEDSECNKWASSSLSTMATEVNKALEYAGMKENRFGLEGYGSREMSAPTARTINGQMFGEALLFLRAVETLKLEKSDEEGSIYEAVQMAMKYPFRPGVAKVLVLAPCSACEVGILESQLAYSLRSQGFSVHILQEQGFSYSEEGTNRPATYRVYGLDNSKTFTNHISDSSVRPLDVERNRPEDYCSSIAQVTSGAVFDTTHLNGKSGVKQEFIKSFAHRVGWDTKLPQCQRCSCNADSGNVECKLCNASPILNNIPLQPVSLPRALGYLRDVNYDVKKYLGFNK